MVESIMRSSKYKTGLFTSPHLFDVRERIRIDGYALAIVVVIDLPAQVCKDSSLA